MKKLLLFLSLILTGFASIAGPDLGSASIISKEVSSANLQNGVSYFEYTVEIKADVDFKLLSQPKLTAPEGFDAISLGFPVGQNCIKGVPVRFGIMVKYPDSNKPFFPKSISVEMAAQGVVDTTKKANIFAGGKFYFTPYNTIEVFSNADFENSYRVWINEQPGVVMNRIYIPKSAIPISDLNLATDTLGGKDMDDIEIQLVCVTGLAYCVPMKLASDTMLIEMLDDGIDSSGTATQQMADDLTNLLLNASNGTQGITYKFASSSSSTNQSTVRLFGGIKISFPKIHIHIKPILLPTPLITNQFQGTVSGRLTSTIVNDLGRTVDIPLSGVLVLLKEKDKFLDLEFGHTHTDANGNYSISYNVTQSFMEGNEVELYIQIKSKNENYDIKTKNQAVLGSAYDEIDDIGSRGKNAGTIVKNISTTIAAFRTTSWATRCWEFSKNQGIALEKGLTILPHSQGSNFRADGFLGVSFGVTEPTIRLESDDCYQEGTIYHEFGHFQMWNVQGRNFIAQISYPGDHSWSKENTSRIGWTEGWADAHGMIMDAAHWWEDGEYGYDDGYNYSLGYKPVYENRYKYWQKNSVGEINNGLWSEYFIACAIYDLWDGKGKGVPLSITGQIGQLNIGYDDVGNWHTQDDVEFSFYDLVMPLIKNGGASGKLQHINDYYTALMKQFSDCNSKSNIARTFEENRVVFDITEYEKIKGNSMMTDGGIAESKTVSISGELGPLNLTYSDTYYLSYLQDTPAKTIDCKFYPITKRTLNEYIVYGSNSGKTVNLDINTAAGILKVGPIQFVNSATGTLSTCGRSGIQLDNGVLTLGASAGNFSATLEVQEQGMIRITALGSMVINNRSSIIVRKGGTLFIEAGARLSLSQSGQIIVEDGGFICIDNGATVNLFDPNQIQVSTKATIGKNAIWGLSTSNCKTDFCPTMVPLNVEALKFDGTDDVVEIANNPILNLNSGPFTFEAYIQSNRTASGNIQVILSKRNSSASEGFMFGLWGDGHLWAQLAGIPNYSFNQGPILLDGRCHHVVLTRNASNILRFYVDGALISQIASPVKNINSPGGLRIGKDNISGLYFDGFIGEVRIWNVERTQAQLQAFMSQPLVPQANLVALFDMRNNKQTLSDLSGNNNNGILGLNNSCAKEDPTWVDAAKLNCTVGGNFRTAHDFESIEEISTVNAYPNPFSSDITVSFAGSSRLVDIEVINIEGQKILKQQGWSTEQNFIFGKDLETGMYIIKITDNNETKVFKVIKGM